MFLVSASSCLCAIYWSLVLSGEWRYSWSSADRRCSNYIWVINNLIAYGGATCIRYLTVTKHTICNALPVPVASDENPRADRMTIQAMVLSAITSMVNGKMNTGFWWPKLNTLTYWGRNKIVVILSTTFEKYYDWKLLSFGFYLPARITKRTFPKGYWCCFNIILNVDMKQKLVIHPYR